MGTIEQINNILLELGSYRDNEAAFIIAKYEIQQRNRLRGREILLRLQKHISKTKEMKSVTLLLPRIREELASLSVDDEGHYPGIFISHCHKDEDVATALVRVLEAAFVIKIGDIRCTSVYPYRLPVGERTSDRIRAEIRWAKAVLGILTKNTEESSYVFFELGASWGQKGTFLPLLAKGGSSAHIPSPISDLHFLRMADKRQCYQLLDDLPRVAGLRRRKGVGAHAEERISELVQLASA